MNNVQSHNIKDIKFELCTSKYSGEMIKIIFYDENDINVYSHFLVMECKTSFVILKSEAFLKALFKNINEFYLVIRRVDINVSSIVNFLNKNKKIYLKEVNSISLDCSGKYQNLKSITFE